LTFIQCACRFTEKTEEQGGGSKRKEIKELLRKMRQETPDLEKNVFNAIHNVTLDTLPGYKWRGEEHSFLEWYEDYDPVFD